MNLYKLFLKSHLLICYFCCWFSVTVANPAGPPPCLLPPQGNISIAGHSRTYQWVVGETIGVKDPAISGDNFIQPIQEAEVAGIRIIQPGFEAPVQDLAWPGSKIIDEPSGNYLMHILLDWRLYPVDQVFSACRNYDLGASALCSTMLRLFVAANALPGLGSPSGNTYSRKLASCAVDGTPIQNSPTVIFSIGGNDLLGFYRIMNHWEGQYIWLRYILNPENLLKAIFNKRALDSELELWWAWNFHVNNARVANGVESGVDYFLTDFHFFNNSHHIPAQRLLLLDEAPTIPVFAVGTQPKDFYRLLIYFLDYDLQLAGKYPGLAARYPGRVAFLDMYWPFLRNMLFQNATYFWDPVTPNQRFNGDGIHFSDAGILQSGKMMATKMTELGWFPRNPALDGVDLSPLYIADPVNVNGTDVGGGQDECDLLCQIIICYLTGICKN